MYKMESHDSFKYLQHKLWLKERLRIKVSIWLLTIKCWKSFWFTCVKEVCHMSLESFLRRLWFCYEPHLNQRSTQEIMGVQNGKVLIVKIARLPTRESREKRHLDVTSMACHKKYYKGEGGGSPVSKAQWIFWICVCPWLVCAPKGFQLCTNQLVVWFV
jgi:hypothetical protein